MSGETEPDKLDWIFATRTDAELAERYDAWASDYDADHDAWEWVGPVRAVEQLLDLGPHGTVLDAGCGTGRVGAELRASGWAGELVGADLSSGMLAVAVDTGRYDRLVQASLTDLPFDDRSVDAVISTGVFTHGHVGPEAFPEIIRLVRSGGWIVITVRNEVWEALASHAADLEQQGRWRLHLRTDPESFHTAKDDPDDLPQSLVIWQVL